MTTLSVSYPDIPYKGTFSASETASSANGEFNLIGGWRHRWFLSGTIDTSIYFQTNLGSNYATKGGVSNHLIIGGQYFKINKGAGVLSGSLPTQILYEDSPDGSSWTAQLTDDAPVFYGPDDRDYVSAFTATDAKQYHRVTLTFGENSGKKFSKLYLGQSWTPAVAPASYSIQRAAGDGTDFVSSSGAASLCRAEPARYKIQVRWDLLTTAEIASFQTNIARYAKTTAFFLYTTTQHDILDGVRVLHAKLLRADCNRSGGVADRWSINTSWLEEIG